VLILPFASRNARSEVVVSKEILVENAGLRGMAAELLGRTGLGWDALNAFQVRCERMIQARNGDVAESWALSYRKPDKVRVEMLSPERRTIVVNGERLWEYLPARAAVACTDMSSLSEDRKAGYLAKVFSYVAVAGMRTGDVRYHIDAATNVNIMTKDSSVVRIYGHSPTYSVDIDTNTWVMVRYEMAAESGVLERMTVLRTEEVSPGVWCPMDVRQESMRGGNLVSMRTRITILALGEGVKDSNFVFDTPPGVKEIRNTPSRRW